MLISTKTCIHSPHVDADNLIGKRGRLARDLGDSAHKALESRR